MIASALHALGLALEVEDHAVAQRRRRDVADVVDRDRVAALEQRADLGGEDHRLQAARRGAVAHELLATSAVASGFSGCVASTTRTA